ncbi:MAG TPA: prepilin-type N-terminal cleavage/methylation domain-containing protein, partial [Candidatus Wallbacteria bacterium]|nr:prepilin-type N-terminal cleavage/methylation domain-containing protein [Candidatus Wallbacteria bacterium]
MKMKMASGFTLIEILIVISIISILSSIAAVNISSRVKLARDAAVKQNLAVLREACGRYYLMNMKMPASLNELSGAQVQGIELSWTGAN